MIRARHAAAGTALAHELAEFASGLTLDDVPQDVVVAAKLHLLDTVGCALAAHAYGGGDHVLASVKSWAGVEQASIVGYRRLLPAPAVALANGVLSHALDFDDTHTASISHVTAVVAPAGLAVAEALGASGADLVTALVAGSEIVARIGADAAPAYMQTGFHPTSVCGVFGAAAAASRLLGLDRDKTTAALGIAGSLASGIFEYLADGSTTKPLHAGWAAQGGVMAALFAESGGSGPPTVLEGRFGVFATHFRLSARGAPRPDWELGARWETLAISFKPYPACHFVHSALDAARFMLGSGLDSSDIDSVLVSVPEAAVPLVLEPHKHKRRPRTPYEAKFSLQFSLASMLKHGRVGIRTYDESRIDEPEVLDLANRVEYEVESFPDYPQVLPTRVTVHSGGRVLATRRAPEEGALPAFGEEDVRHKFRENAELALEPEDVRVLESAILALETAPDVRAVTAPLRRAATRTVAR